MLVDRTLMGYARANPRHFKSTVRDLRWQCQQTYIAQEDLASIVREHYGEKSYGRHIKRMKIAAAAATALTILCVQPWNYASGLWSGTGVALGATYAVGVLACYAVAEAQPPRVSLERLAERANFNSNMTQGLPAGEEPTERIFLDWEELLREKRDISDICKYLTPQLQAALS